MRASIAITLLALALCAAAKVYFQEDFNGKWQDRWVVPSKWKAASELGEWVHTAGDFYGDAEKSKGIKTGNDARHYGLSAKFPEFSNEGKDLILQFTVANQQNIDCGGGYFKLLPTGFDQDSFGGDSPYHIMFGPDHCGPTHRVHAILTYKGENKLVKREIPADTDRFTHLYTLHIKPDNTYVVSIDGKEKQSGTIEADWDMLPAKEIKDPSKSKPADWVDEAMIDDPTDVKPADWDSIPEMIADADATRPDDWDDELDGAWEAPQIPNPAYKGQWQAKKIANPDYKGPWVHPMIPNPDYHPDPSLYKFSNIGGIGIEIWQVKAGSVFDNIIVTDSASEAEAHAKAHFHDLIAAEKAMFDKVEAAKREAEEASRKAAEEAAAAAEGDDHEGHDHDEL